jgi:selenocysteine lyase/cysteine desulfurase
VVEAVSEYMSKSYVQLGSVLSLRTHLVPHGCNGSFHTAALGHSAGYEIAHEADAVMKEAHDFEKLLMNVGASGEVILGPSTSVLIEHLANSYVRSGQMGAEDEVGVRH